MLLKGLGKSRKRAACRGAFPYVSHWHCKAAAKTENKKTKKEMAEYKWLPSKETNKPIVLQQVPLFYSGKRLELLTSTMTGAYLI